MSTDSLISLLAAAGTWVAVAGAFVAVYLQNRTAKRLMCLQVSIQLTTQYDSEAMQLSRARLASKLLSDPKALVIDDSILIFLENVAHLARRNLLDEGYVWNVFGLDVPYYWTALRHYIMHMREILDDPCLFEELEALSKCLCAYRVSPMGTTVRPLDMLDDKVQSFLRMEANRVSTHSDERLLARKGPNLAGRQKVAQTRLKSERAQL